MTQYGARKPKCDYCKEPINFDHITEIYDKDTNSRVCVVHRYPYWRMWQIENAPEDWEEARLGS